MTLETPPGENRADITIEVDGGGSALVLLMNFVCGHRDPLGSPTGQPPSEHGGQQRQE